MTFQLKIKTASEIAQEEAAATRATLVRAIDEHVEQVAKARDYNNAAALAGYVNSTVPTWSSEAQAFVAWRDDVWTTAYAVFADVQAGSRTVPTAEEVIAELPTIEWPA